MATTTETTTGRMPAAEQRVVLRGVDWETYQKLATASDDQPVLMAYDRGVLELMSPGPIHEDWKTLFGRLIETITLELNLPCRGLGSTRWERPEALRSLEADECYYLTAEKLAALPRRLAKDSAGYPAPDLAIEIDVSGSRVDRPAIYATLGVPEVWRFDGERLRIERLGPDGSYLEVPESRFLPILPDEVVRWVLAEDATDQTEWALKLRGWVRSELLPRRPGGV